MGVSRRIVASVACLLLASACSAPAPGDGSGSIDATTDPAQELAGRALPGLGVGGVDVVMRIGAEGFRLPEDETFFRIIGDRVLSIRRGADDGNERLVVRDFDGNLIREIDTAIELLRAAFVHGDDVYFAGLGRDDDTSTTIDRGVWVAHGDDPPESVLAATQQHTVYSAIKVSPDGRTIGIGRCVDTACGTILIGLDGDSTDLPGAGLIELTNEVAIVTNTLSSITAYGVRDGAEPWRAETDELYDNHYATTDGARIMTATIDEVESPDHVKIEVLDASNGTVERSVLVSSEQVPLWIAPTASSDRYVVLVESWRPHADEGQDGVRVVDLLEGRLLDAVLTLGPVP